MKKINKLLIANRGEIALRIIRSAHEMGIKTVAVYSDIDISSPHVLAAGEAIHIGPPISSESYLDQTKIIGAAIKTGADAIHPGYGFLSENAEFAARTEQAGLIFVGPTSASMLLMGAKLSAKQLAREHGIPLIPGSENTITDLATAKKIAKKIGYPIMIKASAGGGGKGMRTIYAENELEEEIARAQSEAMAAFGDDSIFIEKFISSPRHIEFQILGDKYGNIAHLMERECSIQRRHQKVIEEAPSSLLDEGLRQKMGTSATEIAKACNYIGAGTVEFIVDQDKSYYFLEMNTRLQVEHPVTELILGLDLVKEQIKIAEGQKLSLSQNDIQIRGHAIELRVYSEDPLNNFLPSTGTLHTYIRPYGPGVRVDDGYAQGMEVPIYYDPLIAKLIVHGANRDEAIIRMKRAIDEYKIIGLQTTLPFGTFVMGHRRFKEGNFDTNFVSLYYDNEKFVEISDRKTQLASALAAFIFNENTHEEFFDKKSEGQKNNWKNRLFD